MAMLFLFGKPISALRMKMGELLYDLIALIFVQCQS